MAVRVQTQDDLDFGIMSAEVIATHSRFQKAGAAPVVKQLEAPVTVEAGDRLRILSGDLDIVYPSGETTDTHMRALIDPYWDGEIFQIDMMTDGSTVIADLGYTQQTYSNWEISEEVD